jgi:hypothetical protein
VISGDKGDGAIARSFVRASDIHDRRHDADPGRFWRFAMSARPSDLAARISAVQPSQIFKLPIEAARRKAREILNQAPQGSYTSIVENWRQLPNGQIEFTLRHLPTTD